MKRRVPAALALSSVVAAAAAARADDTAERPALAEAIEVVARGYEASAVTAVPRVRVLDAADIDRRQASTVAEMLAEIPGALVLPDGPRGQFTRLFVRGAASNQTLVLVDGIPQNDATAGGLFDFNDLSAAAAERIELLSGSYGVLYGSEAIGGVVSVTTRRGRGPWRRVVRAEAGSFSTHRVSVGAGGGDDDFDVWLTLEDEEASGERDREGFDAHAATARAGFKMTDSLHADVSLRAGRSRVELPFDFPSFGSTVLPEDENLERRRDTVSTGATFTHTATPWFTTRFTASYLEVESDFTNGTDGPETIDPDFTPGTGDEFSVVRDELDSRNRARDLRLRVASTMNLTRAAGGRSRADGGVEVDATVGGEWLDQDSRSVSTSPNFGAAGSSTTTVDRATETTSGFVLAEARFPDGGPFRRGVLAAGVRRDRHDVFGGETSPFVGGRVELVPSHTTFRAGWGEGFRAPKPSELDDPFVGNTALGAETSESLDVGVSQELLEGRVEVGATWFRLETEGLIAYDASATSPTRPFGQLVNFQDTRTTGVELDARADLGEGFSARAAFTRQNPRDLGTGLPLPNRARTYWSAGLAWERGPFLVSLDATVSGKNPHAGGEYTDPDGDAREAPGRRALVNLAARWRASEHVSVVARIENLLDDEWVATPTSPAGSPIGLFVGVRIEF